MNLADMRGRYNSMPDRKSYSVVTPGTIGPSSNVCGTVIVALEQRYTTLGITPARGKRLPRPSDTPVVVPKAMPSADAFITIALVWCEMVKARLAAAGLR